VSPAAVALVGTLGVGIMVGAVWLAARRGRLGAGSAFLCDTCAYDDPRVCSQPDRPNATRCAEYKRR
jgi:hypothetical protein